MFHSFPGITCILSLHLLLLLSCYSDTHHSSSGTPSYDVIHCGILVYYAMKNVGVCNEVNIIHIQVKLTTYFLSLLLSLFMNGKSPAGFVAAALS